MTAIDKAKELVKKYSCLNRGELENDWKNKDIVYDSLDIECALIAVDEMLDFRNALYINEGSLAHKYLLDIKQEIEKL